MERHRAVTKSNANKEEKKKSIRFETACTPTKKKLFQDDCTCPNYSNQENKKDKALL